MAQLLFDDAVVRKLRPSVKAELVFTPLPGEQMRWRQYDQKLLHQLTRPVVLATLSPAARTFLAELASQRTVTLEQVGWLRGLGRRVSFKGTHQPSRVLRFDEEF